MGTAWDREPPDDGVAFFAGPLWAFSFSFVGGLFLAACYVVGVWMHG